MSGSGSRAYPAGPSEASDGCAACAPEGTATGDGRPAEQTRTTPEETASAPDYNPASGSGTTPASLRWIPRCRTERKAVKPAEERMDYVCHAGVGPSPQVHALAGRALPRGGTRRNP